MEVYESGQAVKLAIQFEADGVQAASYRVTDETAQSVVSATPLALSQNATSAEIEVPASANELPPGISRGVRVVELAITTASRTVKERSRYLIQSLAPWQIPTESLLYFDEAFSVAADYTDLTGWQSASDTARRAALTQAFIALDHYRYELCYDPMTMVDFADDYEVDRKIGKLSCLSALEFNGLPVAFRAALKRAQLLEANDLLGGASQVEKLRREGVTRKETGESSISFVNEKLHRGRLCSRAHRMVAPYVATTTVIQRG